MAKNVVPLGFPPQRGPFGGYYINDIYPIIKLISHIYIHRALKSHSFCVEATKIGGHFGIENLLHVILLISSLKTQEHSRMFYFDVVNHIYKTGSTIHRIH
jgi:hypothetical protein